MEHNGCCTKRQNKKCTIKKWNAWARPEYLSEIIFPRDDVSMRCASTSSFTNPPDDHLQGHEWEINLI